MRPWHAMGAAVALSLGLLAAPAQAGELLTLADFESASSDWQLSSGSGLAVVSTEAAFSGVASVALTGEDSSVSLSFESIDVSRIASLSLYAMSEGGALDLVVFSYADGSTSTSGVMGLGDVGWTGYDLTADLSAGQSLVGMTIYGALGQTNLIDHVSIEGVTSPVPEPATWQLILMGLGLTGALGWGRQRARGT